MTIEQFGMDIEKFKKLTQRIEDTLSEKQFLVPAAFVETYTGTNYVVHLAPFTSEETVSNLKRLCISEKAFNVTIVSEVNLYDKPENVSDYEIEMMIQNDVIDEVLTKREAYNILNIYRNKATSYTRYFTKKDGKITFGDSEFKIGVEDLGQFTDVQNELMMGM